MRFKNSKLAFFMIWGSSLFAQPQFSMNGASQARFGLNTSLNIKIVRNELTGPVRLIAHLPDGWILMNPVFETALYSQTGNDAKAVWLEFPLKDTVLCSLQMNIPEDYRGTANIKAVLEYFKDGDKKQVSCQPFLIEVKRYYSRL